MEQRLVAQLIYTHRASGHDVRRKFAHADTEPPTPVEMAVEPRD